LVAAGGSSARFAALEARGLDATILPYAEALIAEKKGFAILADLAEAVPEFPDRLITVRRAFAEKERPHLKRFLQAASEAIHEIRSERQKEKIVAVLAKNLRTDRKSAEENYNMYRNAFSFPPRVGRKGLATVLELIQQETGKANATVDANRFVDESVIDELEKEGFFKALDTGTIRK